MVTASKLREDVYRILDEVLRTGVPMEIVHRGERLEIVRAAEPDSCWLDELPQRRRM